MERAQQPIALVEKVALASSILSLVGVTVWQWPVVSEWAITITNSKVLDPILSPWYLPFKYLLVLTASASLVLVGFVLYTLWAED